MQYFKASGAEIWVRIYLTTLFQLHKLYITL